MLEVKNLKKSYKTKGGVEVHALDDVSIKFPETGMVFLLGKSGSGKSTLLNVSGGLDRPDGGEIIVKGKSSKDFSQSDFDSYRNTFVGFVFQEYNILSEFNVETNIALALELQGKKNDKAAVDEILKQVDLEGLGKRKPNTLSGGQKQRIAIARALIKEPEIIMADEPTGALDSNTGKQVLDTLKKLSATKLVIVVSHDRDFAEYYGDRIIELKDGKILSDVTKNYEKAKKLTTNISKIGDDTYQIKNTSKLSKEDFEALYKKIKSSSGEVIISSGKENVKAFKKASRIDDNDHQEVFKDTIQKDINIKEYNGKETKFIRSKLPMRHAIKMGASNLKIKPIRLVFTMFLSIVAFTLFGVLSTLMMYNPSYTYAEALQNSDLQTLVIEKQYQGVSESIKTDSKGNSEISGTYTFNSQTGTSKDDISKLNRNNIGLNFAGIYKTRTDYSYNLYERSSLPYYSNSRFIGLTDCGESFLTAQGFRKIAGTYPTAPNEIAISKFTYETFVENGYKNPADNTHSDITKASDLIGKTITTSISADGYGRSKQVELEIVGIYETDEYALTSKFDILKEDDRSSISERELSEIEDSFDTLYSSSFYSLGYVSPKFYEKYSSYLKRDYYDRVYVNGTYFYGYRFLTPNEYTDYLRALEYDSEYADNFFPNDEWAGDTCYTPSILEPYKNDLTFVDIEGNAVKGIPNIADDEVYLNLTNDYSVDNKAYQLCYDLPDSYIDGNNKAWATGKTELIDALARFFNYRNNSSTFNSVELPYDDVTGEFGPNDLKLIFSEYAKFMNKYASYYGYDTDKNPYTESSTFALASYRGKTMTTYKVKGYVIVSKEVNMYGKVIFNESQLSKIVYPSDYMQNEYTWTEVRTTKYTVDRDAQYSGAICKVNKTTQELDFLLQEYEDDSYYNIVNDIFNEVSYLVALITQLETIFLVTGIVTAVFSGLMLLNFISTSISTKQKEIGILRAVGARGSDVFKIYFAEAGIIGVICFVASVVISFVTCAVLNDQLAQGLNIALFDFTPISVFFILVVSFVVCFAGTIFPVSIASRRPPVESIRAL